MNPKQQQILDYGNWEAVRLGGKEAYVKDVSPRTGTGYKADGMDELASAVAFQAMADTDT